MITETDVQLSVISSFQVNNIVCIWKGGVCLSLLFQTYSYSTVATDVVAAEKFL